MKKELFFIGLAVGHIVQAKPLEFVRQVKFVDFINYTIKDRNDQEPFRNYYANLVTRMQKADEGKRRKTYYLLHEVGLNNLKIEFPQWHAELTPLLTDPVLTLDVKLNELRKAAGKFLVRYGAYQKFKESYGRVSTQQNNFKLIQHNPQQKEYEVWWQSIVNYTKNVTNKIVGFFGLGKTKKA